MPLPSSIGLSGPGVIHFARDSGVSGVLGSKFTVCSISSSSCCMSSIASAIPICWRSASADPSPLTGTTLLCFLLSTANVTLKSATYLSLHQQAPHTKQHFENESKSVIEGKPLPVPFNLLNRLMAKPCHPVRSLPGCHRFSSRIRTLLLVMGLAIAEQPQNVVGAGRSFEGAVPGGEGLEPAAAGLEGEPEAEGKVAFDPAVEGLGIWEAEKKLDSVFGREFHGRVVISLSGFGESSEKVGTGPYSLLQC